ncbi:MAG: lysophospholipid acyltransferase family protein [Thermoanaerobaculia bacterium]|nr:1-acyl-sn-glycerol-3-phosphate acyltransferase [Acidobacteriota bacterium]
MRMLRAVLVWLGISLATLLFGIPAILAAFVPPRGDWFLRFARGWARAILAFSGVSVRVLRPERLRGPSPVVLVANHESLADILVLLAHVPFQVRFLAKRSVFSIPVLGWSIRAAGFVPVDRGDRARSASTLDAALARLESGRSVVIFPEETRTRTGELLPFKKGAAVLALRSARPLLPVAISGTRQVLSRESLLPSPGRIVLAVGDRIESAGLETKDRAPLTAAIRAAVSSLRKEAAAARERDA